MEKKTHRFSAIIGGGIYRAKTGRKGMISQVVWKGFAEMAWQAISAKPFHTTRSASEVTPSLLLQKHGDLT